MSYKTKVCQLCGKEYQPTSSGQKYCPECGPVVKRVYFAKWAKENPEKMAKWGKANPEKVRASKAKWNKENPEKCRAINAKWAKENPEKYRTAPTEWKKANPEKCAVSASRYRALKYANTSLDEMLTPTEWLAVLAVAHGHCHYCDKEARLTLDHVIPLSHGGKHSADNVVPACKHCNSSKGNKTLEEWIRTTGRGLQELQTQGATL